MEDLKQAFRRLPWIDVLSVCAVLAVHLAFAVSLVHSDVLYLGGDTTREAWRALTLLTTGHLTRDFSVPFESDLYCLVFVPFIALFKNTVLTLQVAGIAFTAATVAVLYGYLRRTYGLCAAVCLGMIYAVSPLLLAHAALNPEYSIPLAIGIILYLETLRSPRAPYAQTALAGFFTSLHPYFLFPYFGYLAGKIDRRGFAGLVKNPASIRPLGKHVLLFLAGLSPLLLKIAVMHTAGDRGLAQWTGTFAGANIERWKHLGALLRDTWTQLSWGLGSFTVYGSVDAPALLTPLFLLWVFLWIASFSMKESRRWAVTLAAGIIPACLIASPVGLGMRHLLAFLPFIWLMLPPFLLRFPGNRGKYLLGIVTAVTLLHYIPVNLSFRRTAHPAGSAVLSDTGRLKDILSAYPGAGASLYSDNSNLFFDLRYLVPEKQLTLFDNVTGFPPRTALLILRPPSDGKGRENFANRGTFHVSGRTTCCVLSPK